MSPFQAYLMLRQVQGELAALAPDRDPFEAPKFDHDAPGPVFRPDTGSLLLIFVLTMTFAPKLATVFDVLIHSALRRSFGGGLRFLDAFQGAARVTRGIQRMELFEVDAEQLL